MDFAATSVSKSIANIAARIKHASCGTQVLLAGILPRRSLENPNKWGEFEKVTRWVRTETRDVVFLECLICPSGPPPPSCSTRLFWLNAGFWIMCIEVSLCFSIKVSVPWPQFSAGKQKRLGSRLRPLAFGTFRATNAMVEQWARGTSGVSFADCTDAVLTEDGQLDGGRLENEQTWLTAEGFRQLAECLAPHLEGLLPESPGSLNTNLMFASKEKVDLISPRMMMMFTHELLLSPCSPDVTSTCFTGSTLPIPDGIREFIGNCTGGALLGPPTGQDDGRAFLPEWLSEFDKLRRALMAPLSSEVPFSPFSLFDAHDPQGELSSPSLPRFPPSPSPLLLPPPSLFPFPTLELLSFPRTFLPPWLSSNGRLCPAGQAAVDRR